MEPGMQPADELDQQDGNDTIEAEIQTPEPRSDSEIDQAPLDRPTTQTMRSIHLSYKVSTDQPGVVHQPKTPIPPIEVGLENLTFKTFKERVFDRLRLYTPFAPLYQGLVLADIAEEIDWNYSITDSTDPSHTWSMTTRFNWAFVKLLTTAQNFSSDAKISIELRMVHVGSDEQPEGSGSRINILDPATLAAQQPEPPALAPEIMSQEDMRRAQEEEDMMMDDPEDMTISDFLELCLMEPNDPFTRALFDLHSIHHWSAFEHVSGKRLIELGFQHGPARHIPHGVMKCVARRNETPTFGSDNLPREDMTLSEFLRFCHIPPSDEVTLAQLQLDGFYHWSVFERLSEQDLRRIGLAFGPSRLILLGFLEAARKLA
ncbi:hypothetical protein MJO28_006231 [Puccinia striiformis f. sp. tritici]|uniref:Uncharacterized protein n=1 Tax=Puccinia striiformis f. sp. tritici TaxID=168172 RepID=A0ACC0EGV1_9BASI|nr:hypothetical protein Pst134EA_011429 [Puccinia striiformis f. sp. tritici]KAH9467806.1 hypothetical protein Pst134EA_011429 [Puccinia striiformis f. sp. tritici]KAI7953684.1 hypothetical protein MJO28_006231 [Puccinia striiformis f. sp. tritici]KAI9608304.1 hypothetical protein KEM48_003235 [Puccinia striiformis f. sp. tritici PST-130]